MAGIIPINRDPLVTVWQDPFGDWTLSFGWTERHGVHLSLHADYMLGIIPIYYNADGTPNAEDLVLPHYVHEAIARAAWQGPVLPGSQPERDYGGTLDCPACYGTGNVQEYDEYQQGWFTVACTCWAGEAWQSAQEDAGYEAEISSREDYATEYRERKQAMVDPSLANARRFAAANPNLIDCYPDADPGL